jgi:tetratricopeptide (TPR) repeat protein
VPGVFHILIILAAAVGAWLWLNGTLGVALVWLAIGLAALLGLGLAAVYIRRLRAGATPANDLLRARASAARRGGRPGEAAATYAHARDAAGIRRVALDAAHDAQAAGALSDAAEAYFALSATITTARRHGVVPSSLLDRAGESADAAATQLWRSCDRLAVVGVSQSARIEEALRAYERAVTAVRDELESARDGIVQVAVGSVLEAQLAEIASRLARLDHAARAIDESMADAFG